MTNNDMARAVFAGTPVVVNDAICVKPRMQLSENVPVTPEFRAEINEWMKEFFGCDHLVFFVDENYGNGKCIVVSSETFKKLERIRNEHLAVG